MNNLIENVVWGNIDQGENEKTSNCNWNCRFTSDCWIEQLVMYKKDGLGFILLCVVCIGGLEGKQEVSMKHKKSMLPPF